MQLYSELAPLRAYQLWRAIATFVLQKTKKTNDYDPQYC